MAEHIIYGSPVSPFVRKVAAVCIEKGVDFELDAVNVFDPPDWFREISPLKRIPVLRDTSIATEGVEGTIADSSAICGFLEKKFPGNSVYPTDPHALGRALWIEEYADSHLAATGGLGISALCFSISCKARSRISTRRARHGPRKCRRSWPISIQRSETQNFTLVTRFRSPISL